MLNLSNNRDVVVDTVNKEKKRFAEPFRSFDKRAMLKKNLV